MNKNYSQKNNKNVMGELNTEKFNSIAGWHNSYNMKYDRKKIKLGQSSLWYTLRFLH